MSPVYPGLCLKKGRGTGKSQKVALSQLGSETLGHVDQLPSSLVEYLCLCNHLNRTMVRTWLHLCWSVNCLSFVPYNWFSTIKSGQVSEKQSVSALAQWSKSSSKMLNIQIADESHCSEGCSGNAYPCPSLHRVRSLSRPTAGRREVHRFPVSQSVVQVALLGRRLDYEFSIFCLRWRPFAASQVSVVKD